MSVFLDAVVAQVIAGRSPAPRIYRPNAVPAVPGYPYSVVGVMGDQALAYSLDQTHGFRDWRVSVRSFGKTLDAAQAYDDAAVEALLDQRLVVPGYECGPVRLQVGAALIDDPDDNRVVGLSTALIFTATKES